ncbi:Rv3235 family protein [Mycobacterium spongiae]|uniref:Alanine, arginine and proline rich protein n=1 Tax=Mycobacterium spongiae TaxID=886343 RepID=A0A975JVU7_9MYCO|nr:Rv3235 family protein [Mycobacterium spongiae]QUR66639.1 hypothetical protein F6B93_05610 [Mycobacterium spongiae]
MTVSPLVSPPDRGAAAVVPLVDYEPPLRSVARRQSPPQAPLPPGTSRTRRPRGSAPSSSQLATNAIEVVSAPMRQAAMFADATLRRVLEVIDRRRPAAQLSSLLAPSLVDSVVSISRAVGAHPSGCRGAAVLRRTRLQPAGAPDSAAEVFGTYGRGDRVHAIACRVERQSSQNETRWQVVALHIG